MMIEIDGELHDAVTNPHEIDIPSGHKHLFGHSCDVNRSMERGVDKFTAQPEGLSSLVGRQKGCDACWFGQSPSRPN